MTDSLLESYPNNPAGVSLQQQVRRELYIHRMKEKKMARSIFDKLDADPRSSASPTYDDQQTDKSSSSSSQGGFKNFFNRMKNMFSSPSPTTSSSSRHHGNVDGGMPFSPSTSSSRTNPFSFSPSPSSPTNTSSPFFPSSSSSSSFPDPWMKLLQGQSQQRQGEGAAESPGLDMMSPFFSSLCGGGGGGREGGHDLRSTLYSNNNTPHSRGPGSANAPEFAEDLFGFARNPEQLEKNMRDLQTLLELNQQFMASSGGSPPGWSAKLRFIWVCCKFAGRAIYHRVSMSCRRRCSEMSLCRKRRASTSATNTTTATISTSSTRQSRNAEGRYLSSSSSSRASGGRFEALEGGKARERDGKESSRSQKRVNFDDDDEQSRYNRSGRNSGCRSRKKGGDPSSLLPSSTSVGSREEKTWASHVDLASSARQALAPQRKSKSKKRVPRFESVSPEGEG